MTTKLSIVDPNTPEARSLAALLFASLQATVPDFPTQMATIIRLFGSIIVLALETAEPDDLASVQEGLRLLLGDFLRTIDTWDPKVPDAPIH